MASSRHGADSFVQVLTLDKIRPSNVYKVRIMSCIDESSCSTERRNCECAGKSQLHAPLHRHEIKLKVLQYHMVLILCTLEWLSCLFVFFVVCYQSVGPVVFRHKSSANFFVHLWVFNGRNARVLPRCASSLESARACVSVWVLACWLVHDRAVSFQNTKNYVSSQY